MVAGFLDFTLFSYFIYALSMLYLWIIYGISMLYLYSETGKTALLLHFIRLLHPGLMRWQPAYNPDQAASHFYCCTKMALGSMA
jgi:hypothetical protein